MYWVSITAAALVWVMGLNATAAALPTADPGAADAQPPHFESIGADAIPRDVVAALAQDRLGFLWIATGNGLVRYDGGVFRAQQLNTEQADLRSLGWIRALLSARDGRLWIGTEALGLAAFDPKDGRISLHAQGDGSGSGAQPKPSLPIQALTEDLDGAVWAGYRGEGLMRYDPASRRTTRYRFSAPQGSLPDDRVEALLVSRDGTLWVGTWRGLSRRARNADRFEPVYSEAPGSLAARHVTALFEAADGRVWAGTRQGDVAVIDPAGGQGRMLARGGIPGRGGTVTSLLQEGDGTVWVGRATGIELYAPQDGRLLHALRREPGQPGTLAADDVSSLLLDRAGWIWVGGIGVGLQRHNPNSQNITVLGVSPQPGARPRVADVRSVLQAGTGDIWVATAAGDVVVMDAQLRTTGTVLPPPTGRCGAAPVDPASPWHGAVIAMALTLEGNIWLATDSTLYQVDRERRLLRCVAHRTGAILSLMAAGDGTLWVGTPDGLHRLQAGATSLMRVPLVGGQPLTGDVYALTEDIDRGLWVGSVNGLFHLAPGASELRAVPAHDGQGLASPVVIGLLVDTQGRLWLDTAVAGLHRMSTWDGQHASFDPISKRHGLVGLPFGANLLEDSRGRIWTHMHVYDPRADRIDELTPIDGARLGNGRFGIKAKTVDGRLLFGGTKGLMVVRGEAFDRSAYAPPVVVSTLRINGEVRDASPALETLELAADQRTFGVEFAALDFSEPQRLRYAYRLTGFDPDWIDTGADLRLASYSNLQPGAYTLQVRATNRSGVWSPNQLAIGVRVLPAWWQTWPLRVAVFGLVLLGIGSIWQLRTRALRRRHDELEALVQERTAALQTMSAELQQRSAALEASSTTDPLTGLRNRRFLAQHIEADVAQSVRRHETHRQHDGPLAEGADLIFFLVDIDHFKHVNDEHGHAAGDAVLRQMRDRLYQVFRSADHLVRWGGEEFLVVAVASSRLGAAELAERMRAAVADRPFLLDNGSPIDQTCSIGFACFPLAPAYARAIDWADMVNIADAALYSAKAAGRNGWMGVISVQTESSASLVQRARGPLDQWRATGQLEVVQSVPSA